MDDCEDGRGVNSTKGLKVMVMMLVVVLIMKVTVMVTGMMTEGSAKKTNHDDACVKMRNEDDGGDDVTGIR